MGEWRHREAKHLPKITQPGFGASVLNPCAVEPLSSQLCSSLAHTFRTKNTNTTTSNQLSYSIYYVPETIFIILH